MRTMKTIRHKVCECLILLSFFLIKFISFVYRAQINNKQKTVVCCCYYTDAAPMTSTNYFGSIFIIIVVIIVILLLFDNWTLFFLRQFDLNIFFCKRSAFVDLYLQSSHYGFIDMEIILLYNIANTKIIRIFVWFWYFLCGTLRGLLFISSNIST